MPTARWTAVHHMLFDACEATLMRMRNQRGGVRTKHLVGDTERFDRIDRALETAKTLKSTTRTDSDRWRKK